MTSSVATARTAAVRFAQRVRSAAGERSLVRRAVRAVTERIVDVAQRVRGRRSGPGGKSDPPRTSPVEVVEMGHGRGQAGVRRVARRLSFAVAGLMAGASAVGLAWRGLYQDPAATAAMFRGFDLGSLVVATPVLAGAVSRARHSSSRADLVWAGMLAHVVYTYAYYVFGAAFNALFLVHVALFALAAIALVLTLATIDVRSVAERSAHRTPVRLVSAVLAFLAASLGAMWTFYSLRFAVTGTAPAEGLLLQPAPIGHLGYALDLTTLVPGYAAAAALLWRRHPWGFVMGTVLLVASGAVQVNYMLALLFQATARIPGATAFDPQEPYIAAAIAGAAALLLANLRRGSGTALSPNHFA